MFSSFVGSVKVAMTVTYLLNLEAVKIVNGPFSGSISPALTGMKLHDNFLSKSGKCWPDLSKTLP